MMGFGLDFSSFGFSFFGIIIFYGFESKSPIFKLKPSKATIFAYILNKTHCVSP